MRTRWLLALALLAGLALGCEAEIPEGRFECDTDEDCPEGWFCRSSNRCHSSPGADPDAGP